MRCNASAPVKKDKTPRSNEGLKMHEGGGLLTALSACLFNDSVALVPWRLVGRAATK